MPRAHPTSRTYRATPLENLTYEAIRFIRRLIDEGIRPTEGLRRYREAGFRIRTQTWFQAYHYLEAVRERAQAFNQTPFRLRPTIGAFTIARTEMPYRYRFMIEIPVIDVRTGETMTRYAYVHADRIMSRGRMLERFAQEIRYMQEGPAGTQWTFETHAIRVIEAWAFIPPGEPIE